ncbi:hypothetical protein BY458DRAFT_521700 [Sporodiniella umbellata]|nr:hypothetical protein BY458DRAFT_521700 [Sporodiniella umbellata]
MFNDNNVWSLAWLSQNFDAIETSQKNHAQPNSVLEHLPYLAMDSVIKQEYSAYDPFLSYPSYYHPISSLPSPPAHDSSSSSCSEGTPVSDYFTSSAAASPISCAEEEVWASGRRRATMKRRVKKTNSVPEEKTFACEFKACGKMFGRQEHVKRHMRSIHTKEKPYVCPYTTCQKKFARSDNLNQHIRTHRKTGKEC